MYVEEIRPLLLVKIRKEEELVDGDDDDDRGRSSYDTTGTATLLERDTCTGPEPIILLAIAMAKGPPALERRMDMVRSTRMFPSRAYFPVDFDYTDSGFRQTTHSNVSVFELSEPFQVVSTSFDFFDV